MIDETPHNSIETIENVLFTRISVWDTYKFTSDKDRRKIEHYLTLQHNKTAQALNEALKLKGQDPEHVKWEGRAIDNVCRNLLLTKSVIEN